MACSEGTYVEPVDSSARTRQHQRENSDSAYHCHDRVVLPTYPVAGVVYPYGTLCLQVLPIKVFSLL